MAFAWDWSSAPSSSPYGCRLVFTASQVGKGDLYDLSMTVQIPVLGIVVTGIIWGLLFRHTGGVTWAIGIGLVLAIAAGLCAGLSTAPGVGPGLGIRREVVLLSHRRQAAWCGGRHTFRVHLRLLHRRRSRSRLARRHDGQLVVPAPLLQRLDESPGAPHCEPVPHQRAAGDRPNLSLRRRPASCNSRTVRTAQLASPERSWFAHAAALARPRPETNHERAGGRSRLGRLDGDPGTEDRATPWVVAICFGISGQQRVGRHPRRSSRSCHNPRPACPG